MWLGMGRYVYMQVQHGKDVPANELTELFGVRPGNSAQGCR